MSLQNNFPIAYDDGTLEEAGAVNRLESGLGSHDIAISKRIFDIVFATVLTVLLSPLLLVVLIAIKLADQGPAIFKQKRIGRNGEEFLCWKFRTMIVDSDSVLATLLAIDPKAAAEWNADQKLKDDPRITKMGCLLRKTSLDELPQLWNILKGDMSLVGPRPIVKSEVKRYGRHYRSYTSVLPGVTGIWQVSGRNETSYEDRVLMDVEYVNTRSLWNDIKIILMTIPAVLSTKGAY